MNRKTFFKVLAGVIIAPSLFANFKEKFLYKDIVEAKKILPKVEWYKKDSKPSWIDVTGFSMDRVKRIVCEDGTFVNIKNNIWVRCDEYIMYKYSYYSVWEYVKSDKKQYLHYTGTVIKKNNYFGWTIKDGENCRDIAQQIDIDYKL